MTKEEIAQLLIEKLKKKQQAVIGFELDYCLLNIEIDTTPMIPRGFILN